MPYTVTLLLCLLGFSLTQAWISTGHHDDDSEEVFSARWHLAYESWQRKCKKYELPEQQLEVSPRIARGELAEPGMFPYQAALLLHRRQGYATQCGGSLISLNYVLTAAHCLNDAESGQIYLGSNSYADAETATQIFQVHIWNFNVFPGYLGFAGYHDLALIHLPHSATPSTTVEPIPLALDFMQQSLLQGQLVSSSGWGALGDGTNGTQSPEANLLHYVDVTVLEQERCICYFLPGLVSVQRHICSDGREGRGSCQGDSGGPLVYRWHNVSYLIGVTSFGSTNGCEQGSPTVYTRITAYLEWIRGETDLQSIE
ncbi:PREDICTED: brachyurin [Drosophila arizonae]|uniref:Brachyurin n=1 Tax=Drosophila arizonae TaxID=7263 RepID=A0ABM1P0U3_DROAR|nr:PREDICTED: brachyurin [Drosophila arizonae]